MSEITKKLQYTELPDGKYQALFKYTDGSTVLGVITYENGDVYMGEIKADESFDEKRDRRRHGYGKLLAKRGKTVDGEWNLGRVVGESIKFEKNGRRTFECRSSDPSSRPILYDYYLTEDNQYGGDRYNGLYKEKFFRGEFMPILDRGELREILLGGGAEPAPAPVKKAEKEPAPVKKAPAEKKPAPAKKKTPEKAAEAPPAPKKPEAKKEAPKVKAFDPEEVRKKAEAAKESGDTETAIKLYFEAAKYADIQSVLAYVRLAAPDIYAPVDKERAEFTAGKLVAVEKKLRRIERNIFGKPTGKRVDGTGMRIVEEAQCDDSPYAQRLKASCCRDEEEKRRYLALAANRGDYLAIWDLLKYYEKDSTVSYDGRQVIVDGVFDPDQLWHYLFVLFILGERRILWFTSEKLQDVYSDFHKYWRDFSFRRFALNRVANILSGLVERDVAPGPFDTSVAVPEDIKPQIFRWLSYLVQDYLPCKPRDYGRYTLAYMLDVGYGCDKDPEKARSLVCGGIEAEGGGCKYAKDDLPNYEPMAGAVAYLIASRNIEQGVLDEETKELLTFAVKESGVEDYRKLAQNKLDLFIEDDSECFDRAMECYNAGDYEQAVLLWRSLADKGHAPACRNVVAIYINNIPNEELSDRYIEKGAQLGDGTCLYNKAIGLRDKGEYAEAYGIFEKVAGMDIEGTLCLPGKSFFAMAEMLYDGQVKKVYGKEHAIYYAHKAEELGAKVSRSFSGEGIKWMMAYKAHTTTEAFRDFALQKGIGQNNPYAHLEMGIRYLKGSGVERDLEKAEKHLRKSPDGTRREYYMMYRRVLGADDLYNSESDELREYAVSHLLETCDKIWQRIRYNEDYSDPENLDPYMDALLRYGEAGEGPQELEKLLELKDTMIHYCRETGLVIAFVLALDILSSAMRVAEKCGRVEDANAYLKEYLQLTKDGVERELAIAETKAQELMRDDESVRYMLTLCVCSRDDRAGMALQRFVLGYASDEPLAEYIMGAYYSGAFTTEKQVLDMDLARRYLKRVGESGFEKASSAYLELSSLELKMGNPAQCEVYLKKSARMGNEKAQAICRDCGYSW